jgi:HSP20 family molecular chaperone IbpA
MTSLEKQPKMLPDMVEAKYEAGILKILIPKNETLNKIPKREIKIK